MCWDNYFFMGLQKFRRVINSTPIEQAKGILKGQLIKFFKPKRYRELKQIRPKRSTLVKHKKIALSIIRKECNKAGINPIKIFGVVKTIGSIDRKERLAKAISPEAVKEVVREDFIGITVVVKTQKDCYTVLNVFKQLGVFPITYKQNPIDYMKTNTKSLAMPDPSRKEAISGVFELTTIPTRFFLRICTKDTFSAKKEYRGERTKKIWKKIKAAEKQK